MLITSSGKIIRMPVNGIRTMARNTQGVRLIRVDEGERVVAVENLAERESEAGEVQAAPVEVIEDIEDVEDDVDGDDTVQTETQSEEDDE
jgi:DNA gyrase subunit A